MPTNPLIPSLHNGYTARLAHSWQTSHRQWSQDLLSFLFGDTFKSQGLGPSLQFELFQVVCGMFHPKSKPSAVAALVSTGHCLPGLCSQLLPRDQYITRQWLHCGSVVSLFRKSTAPRRGSPLPTSHFGQRVQGMASSPGPSRELACFPELLSLWIYSLLLRSDK